MSRPPISTLLPPYASAVLVQAAQTPITPEDPLARVKAIEQATKRVMAMCPHLYRKD